MSFGNLSGMLNKTCSILENNLGKNKSVSPSTIHILKQQVYNDLKKDYADVSKEKVNEIFNRIFTSQYIFSNNISFENGANSFREFEDTYPDIKVPSKYKELEKHFNKLKDLPQPAQRSKEWYEYRHNRITASDMAEAMDLSPYKPVEHFIRKKCDPNFPFLDNATVFHGKKYEPTATMIYEHIYNTRVFEFGALPSEKYSFLGASPDGICSKYTLDNKFSERLGTMLEIKCPVVREITTSGKIAGEICPFYYYCQVQQQLACCELDVCDFWQCKLIEYKTREEYLNDTCESCVNTVGTTGTKIDIDNRLKKGIILEFYPKVHKPEFEGDLAEWKSKYIIPKRLDMDETQYNDWVMEMMDKYKELYPEIAKDYYFYRIIYWKLSSSHNVEIKRDDKFFTSCLPLLEESWEKIQYYRKNLDKLPELKKIEDARSKYITHTTSYTIHNNDIISKKALFLSPGFDCTTLHKTPPKAASNWKGKAEYIANKIKAEKEKANIKDNESDGCDFVSNDECEFIDNIIPQKEKENKVKKEIIKISESTNKIKHTDFTKQTKTEKTEKPFTKSFIKSSIVQNDNNDCDFVD